MSQLDEELAKAINEPVSSEVLEHEGGRSVRPAQEMSRRKSSIGLLIGLVLMGVAILTVVFTGVDNATVYSKGVDQLLSERDRFSMRNVRVLGVLVRGSLTRRETPCEYRFRLAKAEHEVEVHYPQCVIPDTFRDMPGVDVEVTAEGKLQKDGTFLAHQIMAKCPSKYDMKKKSNAGENVPHVMGPTSRMDVPVAPSLILSSVLDHPTALVAIK
jgi:cytochrome c-type biogenesis protein CcmE